MFYAITGKLRSGKSLFACYLIQQALIEGRKVATNFDLDLSHLVGPSNRGTVVRLPDHPQAQHFESLGLAYEGEYDEHKNGVLMLDEVSHFLSSRTWNAKGRPELLRYLTHSGKLGWDVYLIAQDGSMIDSLARDSFIEGTIRVRNMSRQAVPFVGGMLRSFGLPHYLPRFHLAVCRYTTDPQAPIMERWTFRGSDLFKAYNTRQLFGDVDAPFSYLSHWHLAGRYQGTRHPLWWYPLAVAVVALVRLSILLRLVRPADLPPGLTSATR